MRSPSKVSSTRPPSADPVWAETLTFDAPPRVAGQQQAVLELVVQAAANSSASKFNDVAFIHIPLLPDRGQKKHFDNFVLTSSKKTKVTGTLDFVLVWCPPLK